MGDLAVPERPNGRHAAMQAHVGVPVMPVIRPSEQYTAIPYPLLDGVSPTIGWQWQSKAKSGPAFVIIRRGALGSLKVVIASR